MRLPLALERHAQDHPQMTALDLLWWWHDHLGRLDEARHVLAGVTQDELATAVSDWQATEHVSRHQGWARDVIHAQRRAARTMLRTRMTIDQICAYLGCDPIAFASAVTPADHVDRWLQYEAAMADGEDPLVIRHRLEIGHQAELRWRRQRPWRADEWQLLSTTEQGRIVAKLLRPMWEAGLTPTEAVDRYSVDHADRIPNGGLVRRRVENLWGTWRKRYGGQVVVVACEHCGGDYQRYTSKQRYCSQDCWAAASRVHATRLQRACAVCGEAFETWQSKQQYCGGTCRRQVQRAQERAARQARRRDDNAATATDTDDRSQEGAA